MTELIGFIGFIVLLVLLLCRKSIKASLKGKIGERKVNNELANLPEEYEVLENVTLRTARGTTQIDHIVVSKYAIFAIETKNYRGQIYGSDYMDQWKQIIRADVRFKRRTGRSRTYTYITKNTFYNPVKQARGHVIALQKFLTDYPKLPIVPIVVFTGNVNIETISTKGCVLYQCELCDEIAKYHNVWLTAGQVEDICEALRVGNISDILPNREHVRNIRQSIREKRNAATSRHCPRCGGILYKKYGTHGTFLGCGNFPRCSYAENIEEE